MILNIIFSILTVLAGLVIFLIMSLFPTFKWAGRVRGLLEKPADLRSRDNRGESLGAWTIIAIRVHALCSFVVTPLVSAITVMNIWVPLLSWYYIGITLPLCFLAVNLLFWIASKTRVVGD